MYIYNVGIHHFNPFHPMMFLFPTCFPMLLVFTCFHILNSRISDVPSISSSLTKAEVRSSATSRIEDCSRASVGAVEAARFIARARRGGRLVRLVEAVFFLG